jgi:hypothetical protein
VPQAVCLQEVLRQPQVRQRAAFHPGVRAVASPRRREPALPSGPVPHLAPLFPGLVVLQLAERPDVRAVSSERHLAPAWRLVPVPLQLEDHRGVRAAWCQALAVSCPAELPVLRATEQALPPAQAVPQDPLKAAWLPQAEEAAGHPDAPVLPQAAESASVRAAAGPLPEAAEVSVHVAAELRPEAAAVPWVQQAVVGAAEEPDGSRAARPGEAAASDVPARQPAEARRADVAGQPPAAVRPVPWAEQAVARPAEAAPPGARRAADPLALPSEAASVFRQGPILAGPARPRAARFAHAMRSLQIASRSEPSWQAARNEGWSFGSTSPEGSLTKSWCERSVGLTKCWNERLRVRPHCGGRSGRGPIYFCTQITSL